MILFFGLFGIIAFSNLYFGSQSLWLYQSGRINITKRFSLKIINYAIKKESDPLIIRKLINIKKVYIVYLIIFYTSVFYAFFKVYMAANGKN